MQILILLVRYCAFCRVGLATIGVCVFCAATSVVALFIFGEIEMAEEKKLTGFPSIDKPWLKYYSPETINANIPACTVFDIIYERNEKNSSDTALIFFGKEFSYRKLFREIERTTAAFSAYGVKENDNVVICMPAVPETLYAILALNILGANACLMNPTFTTEQLIARIGETEASLLITLNELFEKLENVIPQTSVRTVVCCPIVNALGTAVKRMKKVHPIKGTLTWDGFVRKGSGIAVKAAEYRPDRPAVLVYSSGTTGASKGIQLTNNSVNSIIRDYSKEIFPYQRGDRCFTQIPIWFSTGIILCCLGPLALGGVACILEPVYDFEIFQREIEKYKPTQLVTPSILIEYLIANNSLSEDTVRNFKYLCVGGDYIAPRRESAANEWLLNNGNTVGLQKGYGTCECGSTVTTSTYGRNAFGSAGIPLAHITVAAFDLTSGKELRYGERGELRVNSPCCMLGYFKKPEATAKYFHTDESGKVWACTGDMGYVDEDGSVYVSGRIENSYMNHAGEIVYLFDIERAVLDIPQVRQCKAVASEIGGVLRHVCHTVLTADANREETLKAIRAHCAVKFDANHQPTLFRLYEDALPVAPSGKLDVAKMQKNVSNLIDISNT